MSKKDNFCRNGGQVVRQVDYDGDDKTRHFNHPVSQKPDTENTFSEAVYKYMHKFTFFNQH